MTAERFCLKSQIMPDDCRLHYEQNYSGSTMDMVSLPEMPLREFRPDLDLPESIESVISKALNKDPERRYQSMKALKEDLERIRWNQRMSTSTPP